MGFHGVSEAGGWENARKLILANPMLGGDPAAVREGEGLPMFTYALGHALPGALLGIVAASILIPLLEIWNIYGAPVREKLQGKREDVRGVLATVLALVGSAPLIAPFHKHLTEGT